VPRPLVKVDVERSRVTLLEMLPASLDLVIFRDVTFNLGINCLDSSQSPVNITGYIPYAQVRDRPGGRLILDLQPTISNASTGSVLIALTSAQTKALDHGTYVWDFQMRTPVAQGSLIIGPFLAGRFVVNDSATNT
jgi:hypothetical protein